MQVSQKGLMQTAKSGLVHFVFFDDVMDLECNFSSRALQLFLKLKDSKPMGSLFHKAAERGVKYIEIVMNRHASCLAVLDAHIC